MKYEEKIERLRTIIVEHNEKVGPVGKLDVTKVLDALLQAGGTSDGGLKACSFEDLESAGLPKLMARQVARVFRGGDDEGDMAKVITEKRAASMTPKQLLAAHDVLDPENAVGKRLTALAKGKRCIIFAADGAIDIEASAKLLDEIRQGETEREHYGTPPRQTYRIGERPVELADENPLLRGRALRRDGTCDQTNRSWEGVSYEVRALLCLAVHETGEAQAASNDQRHDLIERAIAPEALEKLRGRYPRASVRFDELQRLGNLPKLKVPRGSTSGVAGRMNDPFGHIANLR